MTETEKAAKKTNRGVTSFDVALGDAIREARVSAAMSQGDVAARIGVTLQQMMKYENGLNRVAASRLVQIGDAINVDAADLISRARGGVSVKPKRAVMELMRAIDGLPLEAVSALRVIAQQMRAT